MENQILTDPMVKPENKVLETALGKNYKLYTEFVNKNNKIDIEMVKTKINECAKEENIEIKLKK